MPKIDINPQDPSITMFVVDDTACNVAEMYAEMIKCNFPVAKVTLIENSGYQKIEELIVQNLPTVIFLDSNLGNFAPHPVFGQLGENLIPFIKANSPHTKIVGISSQKSGRDKMIERGADTAFDKCELSYDNLTRSLELIKK